MEPLNVLRVTACETHPTNESPPVGGATKLMESCQEFESIFFSYLLKNMRETIPKTGFLPKGLEEEIFQSMLDQEIAKKLAQKGIGIAAMLYRQLSQNS